MKEKQTLIQNLSFMALMAAINTVFSLVALFFPLASLLLTIALPMATVLVVLTCKLKYFPIYAVATLALSLLVTLDGMETTLFYLLPALIAGFAFGFLMKKKVFVGFIVLGVAFIQLGISYGSILLIRGLFETDMVAFFSRLLSIDQSPFASVIMPSFFFVIALAQTAFSFIVIHSEIQKFGYDIDTEIRHPIIFPLIALGTALLITVFSLFAPDVAYLLFAVCLYFSIFSFFSWWPFRTQKWLIFVGVLELLTLFIFAALFDSVSAPLNLLLVGLFFLPADILTLVTFYFKKPLKTIK